MTRRPRHVVSIAERRSDGGKEIGHTGGTLHSRQRDALKRAFKQMHLILHENAKKKKPQWQSFFSPPQPIRLARPRGAELLAPLKIITFHAEMTGGRFSSALCVSEIKRGLTEAAGRHGCCFITAYCFSLLSRSASDAGRCSDKGGKKNCGKPRLYKTMRKGCGSFN